MELLGNKVTICIVGANGVGKSSIMLSIQSIFELVHSFLINENSSRYKKVDLTKCLSILELSLPCVVSEEKNTIYFYVFDICDPTTLDTCLDHIKKNSTPSNRHKKSLLLGNRIDCEYWRRVSLSKGTESALLKSLPYYEVSTHSGQHIPLLVDIILSEILGKDGLQSMLEAVISNQKYQIINELHDDSAFETMSTLSMQRDVLDTSDKIGKKKKKQSKEEKSKAEVMKEIDDTPKGGLGRVGKVWSKTNDMSDVEGGGRGGKDALKESIQMENLSFFDKEKDIGAIRSRRSSSSSLAPVPPPQPAPPSSSATSAVPSPPPPPFSALAAPSISSSAISSSSMSKPPSIPQKQDIAEVLMKRNVMVEEEMEYAVDEEGGWNDDDDDIACDNRISDLQESSELSFDIDQSILEGIASSSSIYEPQESSKIMSPARESSSLIVREEDVTNILLEENISMLLEKEKRVDMLEMLEISSIELHESAASFKKQSKKKGFNLVPKVCCLCIGISKCCVFVGTTLISSISECYKSITKKMLFDNVLADTENAFQTLAKFLTFLLVDNYSSKDIDNERNHMQSRMYFILHVIKYCMYSFWIELICWVISYIVILSSTIALILPSFFTLLIIRTNVIEKESKNFGVRQEVIRHEKKEESLVRWLRIILRSLPLSFYLLALPYLLVYHVVPTSSNDHIVLYIVLYLVGVIILQVLGSVRAYYSWKSRDFQVPTAPPMYYTEKPTKPDPADSEWDVENDSSSNNTRSGCSLFCCALTGMSNSKKEQVVKKKTTVPSVPNIFKFTAPSNLIEIASLSLEFLQMASFPLQNDPYQISSSSDNSPTSSPTQSPFAGGAAKDISNDDDIFWGQKLYEILYVDISFQSSDITYACMWTAVALVILLVIIFSIQFLFELKLYGSLMRNIEDKDKAKDSFFYSFTGSIVYGHGKPNNISDKMRLVVSILSDALFLIISLQLLQVLACDFDDNSSTYSLRADESITCWEGQHKILAMLSLICYAFYVPLSIMITPMLLEAPRKASEDGSDSAGGAGGGVKYLKLYLMSINVIKSVMLLVTVMGPQVVSTSVISTTVASLTLGSLTLVWFQSHEVEGKHYSVELQPCNISFINYWKAASYTAAVTSAIVVVIAHNMVDSFSSSSLTYALCICWIVIIASFSYASYQYEDKAKSRRTMIKELIEYPFYWRDRKESLFGEGNGEIINRESCALFSKERTDTDKLHVPGSLVSPWYDYVKANDQSPVIVVRYYSLENCVTDKILNVVNVK